MIPIHSIEDIELVDDKILREGLRTEFKRLPSDFIFNSYGYFIIIESIEELQRPIPLEHSCLSYTPEPLSNYVEMIEEFDGYCQVVCVLEADFGVSLFVSDKVADNTQLETFFEI
ncbi:hypothetical protein SMGD1_2062 [Sulfurimonas gotlandica GD1]|uniref:Uncharacterized protein n=1 Tax=Sulfurimonas gotlandica (strain DSM 19862 / JCM 16533 / GD1) TaxID=929558 RepID=B6BJ71_SULGG|nr:hypothetical protein [Sulfurimonas gotlandica]EDZ63152.1 hypothetical protein CBGD1_771 [Sulfurimonas gotlandica GD1]EHP30585.1 hypothetical protein SMGD1_2062 [Sulfurimonas gotlandica GD1]